MSDERKDALSGRFGSNGDSGQNGEPDRNVRNEGSEGNGGDAGNDESEESELRAVNMRLPKPLADEIHREFRRLNYLYEEEHGDRLTKKEDYYPVIALYGVANVDVETIHEYRTDD